MDDYANDILNADCRGRAPGGDHDPRRGHHAFGAEFDPDAPIRLQGKVVKLEWVNPHAWIHIEVAKPDGTKEVWMVEGGTPNTLLRRGLDRAMIADGYRHRARRRRLSDQGSLAEARQRPRRHVHRRPQDVHGLVGHRRAARTAAIRPRAAPKKPPPHEARFRVPAGSDGTVPGPTVRRYDSTRLRGTLQVTASDRPEVPGASRAPWNFFCLGRSL